MAKKAIVALGVALMDILSDTSEEDLVKYGLKKGCVNFPKTIPLIDNLKNKRIIPGGSSANVVANSSYLGLKKENGFIGTVGNDENGKLYKEDLRMNGVVDYLTEFKGKTGVSYIFITPDHERTSIVDIGVSGSLNIPFEKMDQFRIFHTSLYEIATDEEKTMKSLIFAYNNIPEISFDLSDFNLVTRYKNLVTDIIKHSNIVFANEKESKALTSLEPEESIEALSKMCDIAVIKLGKDGSLVKKTNGPTYRIPCYPANVVDTNGAGDAYSAGFLYGRIKNFNIEECGNLGSFLAARICERYGARMLSPTGYTLL
jgi:sugar/nucleoside kinase (ribokinase family)